MIGLRWVFPIITGVLKMAIIIVPAICKWVNPPATASHLIKGEHTSLKGDFPGNSRCTCGNVNLMITGYLMRQEIL